MIDRKHHIFLFRFIESCTEFNKSFTMQADLGLNILFLLYFFLRVCSVFLYNKFLNKNFFLQFSLLHPNINDVFGLVYIQLLICLLFHHHLLLYILIEIGLVK
jgi:hypothetical protein